VDRGEHVGQPFGQVRGLRFGQHGRVLPGPEHHPGHVFHQVEGRAEDLGVVTERHRPGHRHLGAGQRAEDAELPRHVVRGRQHMAERRPSQHQHAISAGAGDGQAVGQVGAAARDQLDIRQFDRLGRESVGEPFFQPRGAGNSRRSAGYGHDLTNRRTDRTENLNVPPLDYSRMVT
jgi:hypothetical protein